MPYIQRNKDGKIKGVFARLQQGYAEEFLPDDDAEVLAYQNPIPLSDADQAEQEIKGNKTLLGIIGVLADKDGVSDQQIIDQIKAKL